MLYRLYFYFIGELAADEKFCSVCLLRSIIMDIHPRTKNKCDLFPELAQASAVRFARQITELYS